MITPGMLDDVTAIMSQDSQLKGAEDENTHIHSMLTCSDQPRDVGHVGQQVRIEISL